jgi:hypothetical protein
VLRAALQGQAEILRSLGDAFRQVALVGDDPGVSDATARRTIVLVASQALARLEPRPSKPPVPNRLPGYRDERRQRGLCPICGVRIQLIGDTTDGRYIGSCQDAFWPRQWRQLGPRIGVKP